MQNQSQPNIALEAIASVAEKWNSCLSQHQFYDSHWEKNRLHISQVLNRDEIETVFPADYFDRLLTSGGLMHPHLDIVAAGRKQSAAFLQSPSPATDVASMLKQFDQGATLRIPHIENHIPELNAFCLNLEATIGIPIRANLYMSPPFSQGFEAHFDMDDIFALQVNGSKTWSLHTQYSHQVALPNTAQMFTSKYHIPSGPPDELLLQQGDLLYLPRGFMHNARTDEDSSIHLTFAPIGITRSDLLIEVVKMAAKEHLDFRLRHRQLDDNAAMTVNEMAQMITTLLPKLTDEKYLEQALKIMQNTLKSHRNDPLAGEILKRMVKTPPS
jgi:ribosomal protein L16 Arg81 hydroxylase